MSCQSRVLGLKLRQLELQNVRDRRLQEAVFRQARHQEKLLAAYQERFEEVRARLLDMRHSSLPPLAARRQAETLFMKTRVAEETRCRAAASLTVLAMRTSLQRGAVASGRRKCDVLEGVIRRDKAAGQERVEDERMEHSAALIPFIQKRKGSSGASGEGPAAAPLNNPMSTGSAAELWPSTKRSEEDSPGPPSHSGDVGTAMTEAEPAKVEVEWKSADGGSFHLFVERSGRGMQVVVQPSRMSEYWLMKSRLTHFKRELSAGGFTVRRFEVARPQGRPGRAD